MYACTDLTYLLGKSCLALPPLLELLALAYSLKSNIFAVVQFSARWCGIKATSAAATKGKQY